MKKTTLLQNIEVAFAESEELLLNANLIQTTERTSASKEPVSFIDSKFGLWLLSNNRLISERYNFENNFERISKLHEKIYETYSRIYHSAQKSSDSNNNNIAKSYAQLEDLIDMYHADLKTKEKEIKKSSNDNQAVHELNIILKENIDRLEAEAPTMQNKMTNTKVKSKVEETFESLERKKSSNTFPDDYSAVQEKLKNEAQKQFTINKELIEQDIKQVSERQKLFTKAVEQQTHHYQLLQQETKFTTSNYDKQAVQNTELQNNRQKALEDVQQEQVTTQNELDQLALTEAEIEENNTKELALEKEKITEFDQQQAVLSDDIKKKVKQQDRKQQRLDKLRAQIIQAEQELDGFIKDEHILLGKQKMVNKSKSSVRGDIKELLNKQQQKRDQNSLLEDVKHQELKQQKKQFYSLQQEIVHLEYEQQNLIQGKQESENSQQKELEELQKQRKIKQDMLDILDLELHQKDLELQKLTHQNTLVPTDSTNTKPELVI